MTFSPQDPLCHRVCNGPSPPVRSRSQLPVFTSLTGPSFSPRHNSWAMWPRMEMKSEQMEKAQGCDDSVNWGVAQVRV